MNSCLSDHTIPDMRKTAQLDVLASLYRVLFICSRRMDQPDVYGHDRGLTREHVYDEEGASAVVVAAALPSFFVSLNAPASEPWTKPLLGRLDDLVALDAVAGRAGKSVVLFVSTFFSLGGVGVAEFAPPRPRPRPRPRPPRLFSL